MLTALALKRVIECRQSGGTVCWLLVEYYRGN